jgi:hypothetical protein
MEPIGKRIDRRTYGLECLSSRDSGEVIPRPAGRYRVRCRPAPGVSSDRRRQMGQDRESAAAEVERLTRLRDEAEKGSSQHRELNHKLMKARRRLLDIEWGPHDRRR